MGNFDFTPLDDDGEILAAAGRRADSAPPGDLAPLLLPELRDLRPGLIIEGTVLSVSREEIVLDLNHKCEGIIPREELPPHFNVKVGQPLKAMVVRDDGDEGLQLSYKSALRELGWTEIEAAIAASRPVNCRVTACVKASGFRVDIGGVPGFMPFSQAGLPGLKDGEALVGQELPCRIIRIDRERHDVVVSHRKHREEEQATALRTLFDRVKVGDAVRGTVKAIRRDFVFVDIGGVDAFLHASNLAWRYIREPGEVVSVGEEIEVRILEVDQVRQRVAVGLKQMQENPWQSVPARFPVGLTVGGRVVSLSKFGAFIELAEGVTGLVPLREISWNPRLRHANEELAEGDLVNVRIESCNAEEQKLALSIKAAKPDPWLEFRTAHPAGSVLSGTVRAVAGRTAFLQLAPGIEGILRHEDMSWEDGRTEMAGAVKAGEALTALVLNYDETEHLVRLGLKQLTNDPWLQTAVRYPVGKTVEGKVVRLLPFGAFVELEPGVDGLVHISQLALQPVEKVESAVQVGQKLAARVIKVDVGARRINLSVRDHLRDQERQDMKKFMAERRGGGVSLGDMLGGDWRKMFTDNKPEGGN